MRISKNFELKEFIISKTAIDNAIGNMPNYKQTEALIFLVGNILQPCRDFLKMVIWITSGFRSDRLNEFIGGSDTSQHPKGEASDLKCNDNKKLFYFIKDNLRFDQLIWEFGDDNQPQWVHVSISAMGKNRGEVLRAIKVNGKTKYIEFNN
jgi:hypothetical protein